MKLAPRQADAFTRNPGQACGLLIYGPDRGQIRQRANQMIATILRDPQDPFNRSDVPAASLDDDPARLMDELAAMSFTGERRLVSVMDATDHAAQAITEAISHCNHHNFLLVTADELTNRSPLRLAFEQAANVAALACYKEEGANLTHIIEQSLRNEGLSVNREIIAYLTKQLNGDQQILLNELEKLKLYFLNQPAWTLDEVQQVIESSTDRTLDDLIHYVAQRNPRLALPCLDRLLKEGIQPIMMLRSFHRHFGRLLEIVSVQNQGKSLDQAIAQARPPIFFKQVPLMKQQCGLWRMQELKALQQELMMMEARLKSGKGVAELEFQQFILSVSMARAA